MKLFLKQIIRFSVVIFLVFLSAQFVLDSILSSSKLCDNSWSDIFNGDLETDIVILGNSRAEAHYNPDVISDNTGLRSYNLGLSGTPLNILNVRWSSYINRNKKPKILILDVDYNVLGTANRIYDKFQYLPYVNKVEYYNVAKKLDEPVFLDSYFPLYKYSGFDAEIFAKLKHIIVDDCKTVVNGYIPNYNTWNAIEWRNFKTNRLSELANSETFNDLYAGGHEELNTILRYCNRNGIVVFMIWSPQYYEVLEFKRNQREYVDNLLRKVGEEFNVDYFNFSNDTLVYNKSNFYNHSHLNDKGAKAFSKKVSKLINDRIKR